MPPLDLLLRGGTVVRPGEGTFAADIGIADGKIAVLGERGFDADAARVLDATDLHIFPGRVEPHAHIGFGGGLDEYGPDSRAAALGGTTTVLWMVIEGGSYGPVLEEHHAVASRDSQLDFGYNLILMTDEHVRELPEYTGRWGIRAYKYYMSFKGDEGAYMGVQGTDDGAFMGILEGVADVGGVLAVHAENIEIVWRLRERLLKAGRGDLAAWNESRPPFTEAESVERAAYLAHRTETPLYFVHMSSGDALDEVRAARSKYPGDALFAETCPHYLTHTDTSEVGPVGKVNPPLRVADDTDAVWQALFDGTIQTVGSDHVGRRRDKKQGDVWKASAGFPGIPTVLPVMLSEGYHKRGLALERIAELVARAPARIFGLGNRKGDIRVGFDADLAVVDLEWTRRPRADWLGTWSDYSLYEDTELRGWPRYTLLRGALVQEDGVVVADASPQYLRQDDGGVGGSVRP